MRAVGIEACGAPDVLKVMEVATPVPKAGELLVKVEAAGVNPIDCKIRSGDLHGILSFNLPTLLGYDFSGTVVNGGEAVHGMLPLAHPGAYAEYLVIDESLVTRKPKNLSMVEAAAIPLVGQTALQALQRGGVDPHSHSKVLVNGAAGGVGLFALQIAKSYGAVVTAVCSTENVDFVKELGADCVVDYKKHHPLFASQHYDLILDLVGNLKTHEALEALSSHGTFVSILPTPELRERARHSRGSGGPAVDTFIVEPNRVDLEEVDRLIVEGLVKPVVSATFPLEKAAEAHTLSDSHQVRGKLVLLV